MLEFEFRKLFGNQKLAPHNTSEPAEPACCTARTPSAWAMYLNRLSVRAAHVHLTDNRYQAVILINADAYIQVAAASAWHFSCRLHLKLNKRHDGLALSGPTSLG
jgi:hypothetical protein